MSNPYLKGRDISAAQFTTSGKRSGTLLLDGDGICYELSANYKKLETCIRNYEQEVEAFMFLTKTEHARVHLTPQGCYKNGRHLLKGVKPYQGNRKNKPKPPLLEPLRNALSAHFAGHEYIECFAHMDIEADDALMIDAYSLADTVLVSPDKDLQIVPTPHYDMDSGRILTLPAGTRYGFLIEAATVGGKFKVKGKGTKFFWWQMLAGDTADNVKGIEKLNGKLCGDVGAWNALKDVDDEVDCANLVMDGYRAINQNPLPEAAAMWLIRTYNDTAERYIGNLKLSGDNRDFLMDCLKRDWKDDDSTS